MNKPVYSRCGAIFFGLILLVAATTARAQGILFPGPNVPTQPFYVKSLQVHAVITDAVAETVVEQTFVNTSSVEQEGTYLYPLPEGATPTSFSLTVGDRTIEPRILTHDDARNTYESIVRRRRDPALLEYVGRDLLRVSIFPIPPQGERTIRMRYTEVLKPEGSLRKYAYALSTSRFGGRAVGTASVNIKLHTTAPIKNIYSPTHDVSIRRPDEHDATASWEADNITSDRDLALYFSAGGDDVGLSMLTYKTGERDGYFLLLAAPRVAVPTSRILPKQVVFVLDRTGSMNGAKIEQARKSLLFCVNNLHPQDRFDVITFNESPDILTPHLLPATEANVAKARRFVQDIEASGGTNIDEALRAALTLLKDTQGEQKMVVFLTDGLPTVGETDINTILHHVRDLNGGKQAAEDAAGAKARLFCFGLGYDVNVPFLDRLADLGRGESDYVKPEEDIEVKVSAFFAKVTSPILSDVRLAFDGADVYDVYPKTLPDLFKGSQLVIAGRYRGAGEGTVRLTGTANGNQEAFQLPMKPTAADAQNVFLPRLWAARKIGWLVDQIRLSENPAGKQEFADEVVRLSREYGIITEYTSFLADERELPALGLNTRVRGMLGRGGQFGGVGGAGGQGGAGFGGQGGASGGGPGGPAGANPLGGNLAQGGQGLASGLLNGTGINPSDLYAFDADNSIIYAPGGLNVGPGVLGYDADNSVIVAMGKEVLRRVEQGGTTGPAATDQSLLAQSLRKSNQFASRYQTATGHDLAFQDYSGAGSSSTFYGRSGSLFGHYSRGRVGSPATPGVQARIAAPPGAAGPPPAGAMGEDTLAAAPVVTMQAVADRSFVLRNGIWLDTTFDPKKQPLVKVKAFSDAHFALMKAVPNLAAYSSVGDEVIVRLGKKAVLLGKTGQEQLTDADLKALTAK